MISIVFQLLENVIFFTLKWEHWQWQLQHLRFSLWPVGTTAVFRSSCISALLSGRKGLSVITSVTALGIIAYKRLNASNVCAFTQQLVGDIHILLIPFPALFLWTMKITRWYQLLFIRFSFRICCQYKGENCFLQSVVLSFRVPRAFLLTVLCWLLWEEFHN